MSSSKSHQVVIHDVDINLLKAASYNPRRLSKKQFEDLSRSLESFGFLDPVIINTHPGRENIIVGGHQRVEVARRLGYKVIPCVKVNLTLERERELNVRLNKNTGEWNFDVLANEFDVPELIDWGFTHEELSFFDQATPEDLSDEEYLEGEGLKITVTAKSVTDRNRILEILDRHEVPYHVQK